MTFDAVVLAGGRGRRLGGVSKPDVRVAGRALLEHALDATAGARRVVVVGPERLGRPGVVTVVEEPAGGGPVAGLQAGLAALTHVGPGAGRPVLVLACDVPQAAAAVPALLAALAAHPDADGAHLVRDGRAQLVAVHRPAPLAAALAELAAPRGLGGTPLHRLLDRLRMVAVPDDAGHSADADTWDDVARLESVLTGRDTMTAQTPDDLDRWTAAVARTLGTDAAALDRDLVLDLTRDVAHRVARPAVPLTTFLMGIAVGARGGDRAALEAVAAQVADLAAAWGAEDGEARA